MVPEGLGKPFQAPEKLGGLEDIFATKKGGIISDALSGSLIPPLDAFSTSDRKSCGPCSGSG